VTALDRIAALASRRWWLLLIGVALITRLVWAIALAPREPRFDEVHYLSHARSLAEGKGYIDESGHPTAYWPVGYPAALSVFYRVGGDGPLPGPVLQVLSGLATVVLISTIGTTAFGPRIGRFGALLLAAYPTGVFYSTLSLSEPLFTLLLVSALALLLKGLGRGVALLVAAGFVLGLAALVRPVILLLPFVLPIWYWRQQWPFHRALSGAVLVGCGTLIAVGPWLARNHGVTGNWLSISTAAGHDFWVGNHPGAFGGYAHRRGIEKPLHEGGVYDPSRGYRLGLEAIAASPVRALLGVFQKISYFFALETDGVLWNFKGLAHAPPMLVTLLMLGAANAAYLFVLGFAILGLKSTPGAHPLGGLLLVLTGYLVLVTMVFFGDPRFHYLLVPLAAIFAAKGFTEDWPRLRMAVRADDPGARRKLHTWGASVAVFLVLMAANVVLKYFEFKAHVS
jgi:4-amino-4-deoxy-L-arabinose transferase-like glycosyltransferase